jgi:hypothetical protein
MPKAQLNLRVSDLTRRQLDELSQRWGTTQTETLTVIIDRIYREEIPTMHTRSTTRSFSPQNTDGIDDLMSGDKTSATTLKFVAQSGTAWYETIDADDVASHVESVVITHGDIERVEKLTDPADISGETIWRFE